MSCPNCGKPAYIGFSVVECSNAECRNYVAARLPEIAKVLLGELSELKRDAESLDDEVPQQNFALRERRHPQQIIQGPRVLHKTPLGDIIGYDYPLFKKQAETAASSTLVARLSTQTTHCFLLSL